MTDGTIYYVTEERAMAPGIADGWPEIIKAPHTKNGRLRMCEDRDLEDKIAVLEKESQCLADALKVMLEVHPDPCRFDHHGLCQEHHLRQIEVDGVFRPECEMEVVRKALAARDARINSDKAESGQKSEQSE